MQSDALASMSSPSVTMFLGQGLQGAAAQPKTLPAAPAAQCHSSSCQHCKAEPYPAGSALNTVSVLCSCCGPSSQLIEAAPNLAPTVCVLWAVLSAEGGEAARNHALASINDCSRINTNKAAP
jgi:hypothetical protein